MADTTYLTPSALIQILEDAPDCTVIDDEIIFEGKMNLKILLELLHNQGHCDRFKSDPTVTSERLQELTGLTELCAERVKLDEFLDCLLLHCTEGKQTLSAWANPVVFDNQSQGEIDRNEFDNPIKRPCSCSDGLTRVEMALAKAYEEIDELKNRMSLITAVPKRNKMWKENESIQSRLEGLYGIVGEMGDTLQNLRTWISKVLRKKGEKTTADVEKEVFQAFESYSRQLKDLDSRFCHFARRVRVLERDQGTSAMILDDLLRCHAILTKDLEELAARAVDFTHLQETVRAFQNSVEAASLNADYQLYSVTHPGDGLPVDWDAPGFSPSHIEKHTIRLFQRVMSTRTLLTDSPFRQFLCITILMISGVLGYMLTKGEEKAVSVYSLGEGFAVDVDIYHV